MGGPFRHGLGVSGGPDRVPRKHLRIDCEWVNFPALKPLHRVGPAEFSCLDRTSLNWTRTKQKSSDSETSNSSLKGSRERRVGRSIESRRRVVSATVE